MLMLFVAVLAITAAAIVPSITQQVKRDREEELIHRGVQYSRAIRRYVKKFGRYPSRLEELENTNNLRFLRKRYKDPITGQDFRLLHVGEVQIFPGGGNLPGVTPIASAGVPGAGGINALPELQGAVATQAAGTAGAQALNGTGTQAATSGGNSPSPTDAQNPTSQDTGQGGPGASPQSQPSSAGTGSTSPLSAQVFGGGPIVGVASKSKEKTIREFNKKNHYNDWQFIYDPSTDRGGLLNTPAQPALQNTLQNVSGQPGQAGTGVNQSTPFGAPPQAMPQGPPPNQPQQPPQQQQQ